MPRKRNTWSRSKKEKQIITARLIEISLKVEEYVYNQKPVSASDAEQYIREVTSYKTICGRDERSLQVIEKLTRCMKAIIIEHQETTKDTCHINYGSSFPVDTDRAGSITPVYSIPDEDRTQLTQIAEEKANDVTEATKDVETIDLSNIDDDNSEIVRDEKSKSSTVGDAGSRVNVEVDIHKAISNLSLIEVQDVPITPIGSNCSQSILDNFEGIDHKTQLENGIKITFQRTSELVGNITDTVKTRNILKTSKRFANTSNNNITTNLHNNKPAVTVKPLKILNFSSAPHTTIIGDKNLNYNINNKTASQNVVPIKIINLLTQEQTWCDSNRTCQTNNYKQKNAIQVTQSTQLDKVENINSNTVFFNLNNPKKNNLQVTNSSNTTKVNVASRQQLNTATVNENCTAIKKKRGPPKKKIKKEIKPKNKRVYRNYKRVDDKTMTNKVQKDNIPIYNTNVENDLSWMENIRYVREIRVDENDTELDLEESFWNNCHLPTNWTNNEFL